MNDQDKTKEQLIEELNLLRQQVADLKSDRLQVNRTLHDTTLKNSQFMAAINNLNVGVTISDPHRPDNPLIFCNPAFTQITGYTLDEAIDLNCRFLQGPETDSQAVAEIRVAIKEKRSCTVTLLNYHKNGTPFWNKLTISPVFDKKGNLINFVGVQMDVTQRKRAEEALRRSEERFRRVVSSISDHIYMTEVTSEGEQINHYISPNVEQLTGYSAERLIDDWSFWPTKIIHPEDRDIAAKQLKRLIKGQNSTVEYRLRRADGQIIWVRDSGRVEKNPETQSFIFYGVVHDITERKQEEAERIRFTHLLHTAAEVSKQINAILEPEYLLQTVATLLQSWFNIDHAHIYLFNEETESLILRAGSGQIGWQLRQRFYKIPMNVKYSPIVQAAHTKEIIWVDDTHMEEDYITHPLLTETRSEVALPLVAGGRILGVIALQDQQPRRFNASDLNVLSNLSGQIAISLENARLFTERKQAEEALHRKQAEFEAIFSAMPDAVVFADTNRHLRLVNPAFTHLYGYDLKEVQGESALILYRDPQDYEEQGRIRFNLETEEKLKPYEILYQRKDNSEFVGESIGARVKDSEDQILGFLTIIRDITERKEVERAMAIRLRYEKALADCSQSLLVETDSAEAITEALNHLLLASEVSRVYIFENFLHDEEGLCMRQTHEVCAPGVAQTLDISENSFYPYRTGLERWQKILSRGEWIGGGIESFPQNERLFLENHHILAILILPIGQERNWCGFIGFDDTQQQRNWRPEDIQLLRTASKMFLAYIKRKQSEKMLALAHEQALEASRLKSQLLANVSHEIRTPLNAIMGYTEMLQEGLYGPLTEQQQSATHEIIDSTGQLLDFVNNLIDQAQIDAGKVKLNLVAFSPETLVEDICSRLSALAQAKGLSLSCRVAPGVPETLMGDPYWLRQIVTNLVNNALKFTEQGGVTIQIYHPQETDWALQVSDTGVGIPPEAQENIFDAFQQVDGTATRAHGGSGLGLSIVKQLTDLMGGYITLESELNQGSRFTVYLPK